MAFLDMPVYIMQRSGQQFEVHRVSVVVNVVHTLGYVSTAAGPVRYLHCTLTYYIGDTETVGSAKLYGKYVDDVVANAISRVHVYAGAIDASGALRAVVPIQYDQQRSLFTIV